MEENKSTPPFKAGQKVIALVGGPDDYIHKNNVYVVNDCIQPCKCGFWVVDIGLSNHFNEAGCRCPECLTIQDTRARYLFAKYFAPINPYSSSVSKELANEALKERVEVDGPVRVLQNN